MALPNWEERRAASGTTERMRDLREQLNPHWKALPDGQRMGPNDPGRQEIQRRRAGTSSATLATTWDTAEGVLMAAVTREMVG